jgi:hypothetical protein
LRIITKNSWLFLDKRKTGIIVSCSTCGSFRHYPKDKSWPTEHGAHIPSDWLFSSSSSAEKTV